MKYIKTFEKIRKDVVKMRKDMKKPYPTSKYELGDYVILDRNYFDSLRNNSLSREAKIIDVAQDGKLFYWVGVLETGKVLYFAEWMTTRKLMPDEIEQYEYNFKTIKYNI